MKVVTLLGSARKNGNTATVLTWTEEELRAKGHEVERVYLNNKSVQGCLGCNKCKENSKELVCVHKDDATGILEKMVSSDVVLFASPIYFWSFTAQMKGLIDRSYAFVTDYATPNQTSLMAGKRVGLLVTGVDAYENNAEAMFCCFERFSGFLMAGKLEKLYVGGCREPENLADNVKLQAKKFAQSLVP